MQDFVPETYDCVNDYYAMGAQWNYTIVTAEEQSNKKKKYTGETFDFLGQSFKSANATDLTLNVTAFVSENVSLTWSSCATSLIRLRSEIGDYSRIFTRDRHVYGYTASVLQSMLSNVILLQDLNDRMQLAAEEKKDTEFAWLLGRAMRILLVVSPLEVIDDYDYNQDLDDFNLRLRSAFVDRWKIVEGVFAGFTESTLG